MPPHAKPAPPPAAPPPKQVQRTEDILDALPVAVAVFREGRNALPVCIEANAKFYEWAEAPQNSLLGLTAGGMPLIAASSLIADHVALVLDGGTPPAGETCWTHHGLRGPQHLSAQVHTCARRIRNARGPMHPRPLAGDRRGGASAAGRCCRTT